ncbi:MAG: HlyD family efflux transporter periplasmic adaptor subunit [Caldilineaceae bacterium]
MKIRTWLKWLGGLLLIAIVALYLNAYFGWLMLPWLTALPGLPATPAPTGENPNAPPPPETVLIHRAADVITDVKVSGKLEFRTVREVKAPFDETVATVNVEAGALVKSGALLATLDRTKLTSQLDEAWLALTKERQALTDVMKEGSGIDLAEAKAEWLTAQEELAKLQKGPAAVDLNGAQLAVADAQLAYDQLVKRNDPNDPKVRQARYDLKQAENNLHHAQTAYDAISWKGDVAASEQATALQNATLAYENAQAAYNTASKPPTALELQKAQLEIAKAQNEYNKLLTKATPAQVQQAQVRVDKATEKVTQLQNGPAALKVQEAEAKVMEALTQLEDVRTKLLSTSNLQAPLDGQIVKLAVKPGQVVKAGDTVAAVAAPQQFKLTLPVNETYILRIQIGMLAQIALDVLPDAVLTGTVTGFVPIEVNANTDNNTPGTTNNQQLTTYPVTVVLDDAPFLEKLRPGMSAQVTFVGTNQLKPNSWLVPQSALQDQTGATATVQVMRGATPTPMQVTVTEQTRGEWVVVISPDLQEGDMVVGSTASPTDLQPPGTQIIR